MTEQITANMNTVTSAIRQICDKDGNFYFDEMVAASGLDAVAVRQAICFLNKAGHSIVKMRSGLGEWQDQKIYWARRELAKSC